MLPLLFGLLTQSGWAQTSRLFSSDHGLSNSQINQVYQDRRGFMWIATEDGLNHFDGTRFTVYRSQRSDSSSLTGNFVHTVYEDSQGNFWVGTINGLNLYDRVSNSFRRFPLTDVPNMFAFPHVTSILEDRNGFLWVTTSGDGVVRINPKTLKVDQDRVVSAKLPSVYLLKVYEDRNGKLWFGSEDKGLTVYDPASGAVDLSFNRHPWFRMLADKQISDICEDPAGNVVIASLDGGLGIYLRDENRFVDFNQRGILPVKSLLSDKRGTIWIGTDGQGIKHLTNLQLTDFDVPGSQVSLHKAKAHSLCLDNQGNVWVGVFHKGVLIIPGFTNKFEYYGYSHNPSYSIGNGCIMSIAATADGVLWAGTDGNGLYRVDTQSRQTRQYSLAGASLHANTVMSLAVDEPKGLLWVGSYLNGLASFDLNTGRVQKVSLGQDRENEKIFAVAIDDKHNVWAGTYGRGVYRYEPDGRKVSHINAMGADSLERLTNSWINVLRFDEKGRLWIGTFRGVDCFDPATGKFLHFNKDNGFLYDNVVYCITIDRQGNIWVGTSNGLVRIFEDTGKSQFFFEKDGLSGNVINGIEEDANGNLWISTNSGLSRYSPQLNVFTNFYSYEGLQSNEFRRGAAFRSADGKLFFGGVNGITAFYPQNIGVSRPLPDLYFTGLRIFNQPVAVGQQSGSVTVLDKSLQENPTVHLRHTDNVFSIEFVALEYTNPEKIVYRYRMDGFENDWKTTNVRNRIITYTNLSPGSYTFHVIAADNSGNEKQIALSLIILPPWWMSWWAFAIYFVLAVFIFILVMREIHFRLHKNHELLELQYAEQANDARLQLFANISHEIRTPLTLVINPLEQLMDKEIDPSRRSIYDLMHRNSMRILRLMNQLIDVRKIDKGQMRLQYEQVELVGFIRDIINAFDYTAQSRNITLVFEPELSELNVWVDPGNFDKVLFNVLSNALKFTERDGRIEVRLYLSIDSSRFIVEVEDNGIGIPEEIREKIFDRFYQGKTAMVSKGSGVGLHLARRLVEMHRGTIFAADGRDKGALFVMDLPMGNEHLSPDDYAVPGRVEEPRMVMSPVVGELPVLTDAGRAKGKPRLLLAEDDADVRAYLVNELSSLYRVVEVENGKLAWKNALRDKPDVVVSDVMMPEMTGLELCRKLKGHPDTAHVPVILLTALAKDEDVVEGLGQGADAYLPKPFNIEVLKSTIARLLQSRQMLMMKFAHDKELALDDMKLDSADEKLIEKVMGAIQAHLHDSELSVEMISKHIGISRVHLHRKLKELTGQSPRDFIKNIRLKQAAKLLTVPGANVSEVAFTVGFSSHSYFTNCFREYFGVSPTEFVEKQRGEEVADES
ncbi:MAG: response regulator [Marinilabiliaceae bacterium]|nr:response regulator [Marinilabiliaceae bacterium]